MLISLKLDNLNIFENKQINKSGGLVRQYYSMQL